MIWYNGKLSSIFLSVLICKSKQRKGRCTWLSCRVYKENVSHRKHNSHVSICVTKNFGQGSGRGRDPVKVFFSSSLITAKFSGCFSYCVRACRMSKRIWDERGMADPLRNTPFPIRVTMPNLVILRQTIRSSLITEIAKFSQNSVESWHMG